LRATDLYPNPDNTTLDELKVERKVKGSERERGHPLDDTVLANSNAEAYDTRQTDAGWLGYQIMGM
jgi:hypothetical protein